MSIIALLHPSLNRMGGAEKMALENIKILTEAGYQVHLFTIDQTDWERITTKWGVYPNPFKEFFFSSNELKPDNIFSWMKTGLIYFYFLIKTHTEYKTVINNYGEVLPYFSEITFFHAEPLFGQNENKYDIPYWKFIKPLYEKILNKLNQKYCNGIFITNSYYNSEKITDRFHKEPIVIHPFIKPIPFLYTPNKTGEILTIARITPQKNLIQLLLIARNLRKHNFTLMGPRTSNTNLITAMSKDLKNFKIILNPDRDQYRKVITESSIILSTQSNEAFGLSLLEAMSAGCIPVVPKEGGPWQDVFESREGEIGFGYKTVDEAIEKIKLILTDEQLRSKLRENSIRRSSEFNYAEYKDELIRVIEKNELTVNEKSDVYYKIKYIISKIRDVKKLLQNILDFFLNKAKMIANVKHRNNSNQLKSIKDLTISNN